MDSRTTCFGGSHRYWSSFFCNSPTLSFQMNFIIRKFIYRLRLPVERFCFLFFGCYLRRIYLVHAPTFLPVSFSPFPICFCSSKTLRGVGGPVSSLTVDRPSKSDFCTMHQRGCRNFCFVLCLFLSSQVVNFKVVTLLKCKYFDIKTKANYLFQTVLRYKGLDDRSSNGIFTPRKKGREGYVGITRPGTFPT